MGGTEPDNNARPTHAMVALSSEQYRQREMRGTMRRAREGSVGRAREAHVRSALCGSVPVGVDPLGGSTRDRPHERSILGKAEGMVIKVGARQTQTKTTSNCLKSAGRTRGRHGRKTDAVNGDKKRSE